MFNSAKDVSPVIPGPVGMASLQIEEQRRAMYQDLGVPVEDSLVGKAEFSPGLGSLTWTPGEMSNEYDYSARSVADLQQGREQTPYLANSGAAVFGQANEEAGVAQGASLGIVNSKLGARTDALQREMSAWKNATGLATDTAGSISKTASESSRIAQNAANISAEQGRNRVAGNAKFASDAFSAAGKYMKNEFEWGNAVQQKTSAPNYNRVVGTQSSQNMLDYGTRMQT